MPRRIRLSTGSSSSSADLASTTGGAGKEGRRIFSKSGAFYFLWAVVARFFSFQSDMLEAVLVKQRADLVLERGGVVNRILFDEMVDRLFEGWPSAIPWRAIAGFQKRSGGPFVRKEIPDLVIAEAAEAAELIRAFPESLDCLIRARCFSLGGAMNKCFRILKTIRFLIAIFPLSSSALRAEVKKSRLRVITFNVLQGGTRRGQPLSHTAKVIRAAKADIAGLQEVGGNAVALAELLGWNHVRHGSRANVPKLPVFVTGDFNEP